MSASSFIDTNVFVYAFHLGAPEGKRAVAAQLIRAAIAERSGVVSYQVIQEFFSVMLKKAAAPMTPDEAQEYLNAAFRPLLAVHSSIDLFDEALEIRHRHKLSWYDALIVAAAVEAGCSVLYTEDMHHGAKIGGVRIENPFRTK
jgi:predicted nucleic acid-binding protein